MPYNILMYSHDTYGLGHIRRSMAIAGQLCRDGANIIILTGSPIVGRFPFPERVDFVRIPGMIKKTNREYLPLSIKIDPTQALEIRKNIILATARTFQPDLFIVDKEPLGLKKEVLPTLEWLRSSLPGCRSVLGLRDIMDEAAEVRRDWTHKGIYDCLDTLYDEIWVYGNQEMYDPVREYKVPPATAEKMVFTGYIPRRTPGPEAAAKVRRDYGVAEGEPFIVVTTGGGGDGCEVMHAFLRMIETCDDLPAFKSLLVTGPFMPKDKRGQLARRARAHRIPTQPFCPHLEEVLAAADLVISMGGYNTMCELLSQQKPSIIIPRETPRKEQLLRAEAFARRGLIEFIPWAALTPEALLHAVRAMLGDLARYRRAMRDFPLTGLDTMRRRLREFQK